MEQTMHTRTRKQMARHCLTLLWDTLVGHSCRHSCWKLLLDTHSCGKLFLDTLVRHSCGVPQTRRNKCNTKPRGHHQRPLPSDAARLHQQYAFLHPMARTQDSRKRTFHQDSSKPHGRASLHTSCRHAVQNRLDTTM